MGNADMHLQNDRSIREETVHLGVDLSSNQLDCFAVWLCSYHSAEILNPPLAYLIRICLDVSGLQLDIFQVQSVAVLERSNENLSRRTFVTLMMKCLDHGLGEVEDRRRGMVKVLVQ